MGYAYLIIDGQWGSTGKGKFAAWAAEKYKPHAVACDFMPNAGHTVMMDNGYKIVTNHIPSGAFGHKDAEIILGPGCGIDVRLLMEELEAYDFIDLKSRLFIHPNAVVITDRHKEIEAETTKRIASTMKGCGAALSEKIRRSPDVVLAKDVEELQPYIDDTVERVIKILDKGGIVQVEGAQGFDLSLDYGFYPHVTSRNVTPGDIMSRAGIPHHRLMKIFGCIRTFPIRVGNVVDENGTVVGWSGPHYDDQEELTWEDISARCGKQVVEKTTVTGRVRRVFSFSKKQYQKFVDVCMPSNVFLNFVNYLHPGVEGERDYLNLPDEVKEFVSEISSIYPIRWLGTGPKHGDIIDLWEV